MRYRINPVDRERVISRSFNVVETHETVARGWDRINSSERLTIILLIELNTCTCAAAFVRDPLCALYVHSRWINLSEYNRAVKRAKRNRFIALKITLRWVFASKTRTSSRYICRKWIARGRVYFSREFLWSKVREVTWGMKVTVRSHRVRRYMSRDIMRRDDVSSLSTDITKISKQEQKRMGETYKNTPQKKRTIRTVAFKRFQLISL